MAKVPVAMAIAMGLLEAILASVMTALGAESDSELVKLAMARQASGALGWAGAVVVEAWGQV